MSCIKKSMVSFNKIVGRDRVIDLKEPLQAVLLNGNGLFFVENKALDILGCGSTLEQAIQDFHREFEFLWNEYAEAEDQELTDDARRLKDVLQSLVR